MLVNPAAHCHSQPWANFVYNAHQEDRQHHQSFDASKHAAANLIAPRGNIITLVGDLGSIAQDLSPTILTEVIPQLQEAAAAPKGVPFIAACIRKLTDWRAFFCLLTSAPTHNNPKLLTHTGHGSDSILLSDIPPGRVVSAVTTRATIRKIA